MFKNALLTCAVSVCLTAPTGVMAETSPDHSLSVVFDWLNRHLADNPQLGAARAATAAARGQREAADQPLFNPEIEFELERTGTDTVATGISQTLDWSRQREARTSVADARLQLSRAEFDAERQRLAVALLKALIDWNTATDIRRIRDRQIELMETFVDIAERRHQAGDLGQLDLNLAWLAASAARFQQSAAHQQQARARQALATLTGMGSGTPPELPEQLPVAERDDQDRLAQLPAIRAARARIDAARAGVQLQQRRRRPDPSIGIRLGKEGSDTLTGLRLSLPLFVRNRYRAEVDVATSQLLQARRQANNLERTLQAQWRASRLIYEQARSAWIDWRDNSAVRLDQHSRLLDRLWQAGELKTTDYLVQLKQALETETSAIEQRGRAWSAWADYLAASGAIERWLRPLPERHRTKKSQPYHPDESLEMRR